VLHISKFASLIAFLLGLPVLLQSQSLYDSRTIGMGGAAVATSTGLAAVGSNPANLMLFERPQRWSLQMIQGGYYLREGFQLDNLGTPEQYLHPFLTQAEPGSYPTTTSLEELRQNWFPTGVTESYQSQKIDLLVLGISYTGRNFGIAGTHRIKGESTFTIGRGWYDPEFYAADNLMIRNQNISHLYHLRHEFGISLGWEYDLVSGWLSDLSRIYIGFTPKLIVPVSYASHMLQSVVSRSSEVQNSGIHIYSYSGQLAGQTSETIPPNGEWLPFTQPNPNTSDFSNLTRPAGLGAGLDFGFTYILGLDRDVSLTTRNVSPTRYSLRISASLLDIGLVNLSSDVRRISAAPRTVLYPNGLPEWSASAEFNGNPNQFFPFLRSGEEAELLNRLQDGSSDPIRLLLPSRAHAGVALQLNRLVLTGELQHVFNSWTINPEKTSLHAGGELRLLKLIPLRAGFILQPDEPFIYTAGVGLDFRNVSFSAASAMRTRSGLESIIPVLTTAGVLHIRF
jgi:hypothetical protein